MLPLRYIDGNILYGHGPYRGAIYRLDTVSFPFLPVQDKKRHMRRLARLAYMVENHFSLYRVTREYDVAGMHQRAGCDERFADVEAWHAYLLGHEDHLRGLRSTVPEVYLIVSLREDQTTGMASGILEGTSQIRHSLGRRLRHGRRRITGTELNGLREAENRLYERLVDITSLRRATTLEIQWLIRRAQTRGLGEPQLDRYWQPQALTVNPDATVEPLEVDVVRHANYQVTEQARSLIIASEQGDSHQALLAMGALPFESQFPGAAELLFSPLERLSFSVDAVLHARYVPNREASARVKRKIVDADVVFNDSHTSSHGVLSYSLDENRSLARELDAYLGSSVHPPLLEAAISFAVGAPDAKTLDSRVESLRRSFGTIELYRPYGLQRDLFVDHLPKADGAKVVDYNDVLTVEQFAAMTPDGTHEAGSMSGPFIGTVLGGANRPVRFDSAEAPRRNRTSTILMAGTLGSGKTIAGELLAFQAERRGARVVTVDAKPDHALENLPELQDRVHIIELNGHDRRYEGLLDPLVVAPREMREDLAYSYLIDLLPRVEAAWTTQILKAVHTVAQEDNPGLRKVVAWLKAQDNQDAQMVGDALDTRFRIGLARLGYGPSVTSQDLDLPVTTIRPGGLRLPSPDVPRGDYDPMEALSVATLKLVAAYAMRLVQRDRSRHKLLLFDEAWFLLASRDGRRLVDRLALMGRAENATLILATQRLIHVGDVENLAGVRFMFGQETEHDAKIALRLIGLDPEQQSLIERIMGYREGRCMMRDLDGRVAEMRFDVVYPHILEALDTTPPEHAVA